MIHRKFVRSLKLKLETTLVGFMYPRAAVGNFHPIPGQSEIYRFSNGGSRYKDGTAPTSDWPPADRERSGLTANIHANNCPIDKITSSNLPPNEKLENKADTAIKKSVANESRYNGAY